MQASTCAANASLISMRSKSRRLSCLRASSFSIAGTGPAPITRGATPAEAMPVYPILPSLHGGPVCQYSHEFFDVWQWFAANGHAVIAPNSRGSSGRGFDFTKAIHAEWGRLDDRSCHALINRG